MLQAGFRTTKIENTYTSLSTFVQEIHKRLQVLHTELLIRSQILVSCMCQRLFMRACSYRLLVVSFAILSRCLANCWKHTTALLCLSSKPMNESGFRCIYANDSRNLPHMHSMPWNLPVSVCFRTLEAIDPISFA